MEHNEVQRAFGDQLFDGMDELIPDVLELTAEQIAAVFDLHRDAFIESVRIWKEEA